LKGVFYILKRLDLFLPLLSVYGLG